MRCMRIPQASGVQFFGANFVCPFFGRVIANKVEDYFVHLRTSLVLRQISEFFGLISNFFQKKTESFIKCSLRPFITIYLYVRTFYNATSRDAIYRVSTGG
jgi:hypothetical protein